MRGSEVEVVDRTGDAAFHLLTAAVFCSAFSLPTGRALLAVSLLVTAVWCIRRRRPPVMGLSSWLGVAFLLLTTIVTHLGIDPELGVPKLRKLLWFMGMPLAATLLVSWRRVERMVAAYALGCGVLAMRNFVERPIEAWRRLQDGRFDSFGEALIDTGSMTDAQRAMLGAVAALGLALLWRMGSRKWGAGWAVLLAMNLGALLINFKRGSWFCALAAGAAFLLCFARLRTVIMMVVLVLATLAVPVVRGRLVDLGEEFHARRGGRWTMWTRVAPELVRHHPWGVGYRSLSNETLRAIDRTVERNRDHLHSNPVQVLVESGWLGLALYLAWMVAACLDGYRAARQSRAADGGREFHVLSVMLLLMLVALILNGVVEYNLGDGELVLVYGVLIGGLTASRRLACPLVQSVRSGSDRNGTKIRAFWNGISNSQHSISKSSSE